MANTEHLEILKQGVEVWNRWREENPNVHPDLSSTAFYVRNVIDMRAATLEQVIMAGKEYRGVRLDHFNLSKANLSGSFLRGADFHNANLSMSQMRDTNVSEVSLAGSNLTFADLIGADLTHSYLKRTKLNDTKLMQVNFTNSSIIETDFSGSEMFMTVFGNNNLRSAIGLDKVKHIGPSIIDTSTLSRSKGLIPEIFIRGCGVPENFVQYTFSLTAKAIEYYSCFISYSSKDQDFAERLYADFQNKGVRCWFAPEDMKIGDKIRDRIDQSIRIHDKLLLILSEHSINSEWVEDEVETAYEQERDRGNTVLFPIRLDDAVIDTDKAWASKLRRSRHIGDFTRWKDHDAYQKAFDRLMRDLKADEPTGAD